MIEALLKHQIHLRITFSWELIELEASAQEVKEGPLFFVFICFSLLGIELVPVALHMGCGVAVGTRSHRAQTSLQLTL